MTRRERLRACAAGLTPRWLPDGGYWLAASFDLPALALGSALAGYQASVPAWRLADGLLAVLGRLGAGE